MREAPGSLVSASGHVMRRIGHSHSLRRHPAGAGQIHTRKYTGTLQCITEISLTWHLVHALAMNTRKALCTLHHYDILVRSVHRRRIHCRHYHLLVNRNAIIVIGKT